MAGLLDAFNDPEFQRGLLMMAASRPMSEQARAGLLSYVDNQEEAKMKRQYMGMQMEGQKAQTDANRSKLALAQEQAEFDRKLFGGLMGGGAGAGQPQAASASPGTPAQGAAPSGQGGAGGAGFIAGLSPDQLAALKIRGHDLTGIWEQTRPDMQVTNGYAYDKRNLGAGFMPGLQTTADGKSTMTRIGQDGMPVVSAPDGALKTYQDYKESDANIAARNKLMKRYNPETGQEEWVTEAHAINAAGGRPAPAIGNFGGRPAPLPGGSGNVQSPGYAGGDRARANAESIAIMESELRKPGNSAEDIAGLQREIARMRGQGASGGGALAAGPSATQAAADEANRVLGVKRAENQAKVEADAPSTGRRQQAGIEQADRMIGKVDQALEKVSGWSTGFGAALTGIPGSDARNLSATLDTIRANLGFAELQAMREASPTGGALGSVAVQELTALQSTIASLDQSQSPEQLRRGLGEVKRRYENWRSIVQQANGGGATSPEQPAPPRVNASPPPRAMKGMVVDGYKFKGGNPADQSNWERQ